MAITWDAQYKVNGVDPKLYVEHKGKHSQAYSGGILDAFAPWYKANDEDICSYLYPATMPWEETWPLTNFTYFSKSTGSVTQLNLIKDGYLLRNLLVFHATGDGTATYMDGPGKIIGADYNESGGSTTDVTIALERVSDTSLRLGSNYYSPSDFGSDFDKIPYVIGIIICGGGGGGGSLMSGGRAKINSSTDANGYCGSGGGGGSGRIGCLNGGNWGRGQVFIFY